ncbi:hypothetical protein CEXT_113211, partial [Caerostris extrusa]
WPFSHIHRNKALNKHFRLRDFLTRSLQKVHALREIQSTRYGRSHTHSLPQRTPRSQDLLSALTPNGKR